MCLPGTRVLEEQQESFGRFGETKGLSQLRWFPADVKSVESAEKQVFSNNVIHDCCGFSFFFSAFFFDV